MRNPANKQTNKQTNRHTKVIAISRFSRDNKTFTVRKKEKHINNFYQDYSECRDCNIKRVVKDYHDNNDIITI